MRVFSLSFLLSVLFICVIVGFLLWGIGWVVNSFRVTGTEVRCQVKDMTATDRATLVLDCNGKKQVISQADLVVGYIKHPNGALICTTFVSGDPNCRLTK